MRKITEEEYYDWRNRQLDKGIEHQMSRILTVLDTLLMNKKNSMSSIGVVSACLACNCRFLLEDYGWELDTRYKWKELFEVEL